MNVRENIKFNVEPLMDRPDISALVQKSMNCLLALLLLQPCAMRQLSRILLSK